MREALPGSAASTNFTPMSTVQIETAQNVVLHHEVASVGDRVVAWIIDRLVLVAWFVVCFLLMAVVKPNDDLFMVIMIVSIALPYMFYHLVCELLMDGKSIGKAVQKVKVARVDGGQPRLGQYLLRWLLRPIDQFYGLGLVVVLINGKGQRLGDLAAGTTVITLKQRVRLQDTMLISVKEDHPVRFPEAIRLTDAQATMIKEVLGNTKVANRWALVEEMADKVRKAIGNNGDGLKPMEFLRAVLQDYVYLTGQQGEGTGHYKGERPTSPPPAADAPR